MKKEKSIQISEKNIKPFSLMGVLCYTFEHIDKQKDKEMILKRQSVNEAEE